MSAGKLADFEGECPMCEDAIIPGTDRLVMVDGQWVHIECAADEGYIETDG